MWVWWWVWMSAVLLSLHCNHYCYLNLTVSGYALVSSCAEKWAAVAVARPAHHPPTSSPTLSLTVSPPTQPAISQWPHHGQHLNKLYTAGGLSTAGCHLLIHDPLSPVPHFLISSMCHKIMSEMNINIARNHVWYGAEDAMNISVRWAKY